MILQVPSLKLSQRVYPWRISGKGRGDPFPFGNFCLFSGAYWLSVLGRVKCFGVSFAKQIWWSAARHDQNRGEFLLMKSEHRNFVEYCDEHTGNWYVLQSLKTKIQPWRLTWNIIMEVWFRSCSFAKMVVICRFQPLIFQGFSIRITGSKREPNLDQEMKEIFLDLFLNNLILGILLMAEILHQLIGSLSHYL